MKFSILCMPSVICFAFVVVPMSFLCTQEININEVPLMQDFTSIKTAEGIDSALLQSVLQGRLDTFRSGQGERIKS